MNVEIKEKFPVEIIEEGTLMDFIDQEFVFVIKDETWMPYELQCLKQKPLEIQFVYKYDIAVFLLTIEDALDTSDFIFNVHDNTYGEELFLPDNNGYACSLYFWIKKIGLWGERNFIYRVKLLMSLRKSFAYKKTFCIRKKNFYAIWKDYKWPMNHLRCSHWHYQQISSNKGGVFPF